MIVQIVGEVFAVLLALSIFEAMKHFSQRWMKRIRSYFFLRRVRSHQQKRSHTIIERR